LRVKALLERPEDGMALLEEAVRILEPSTTG
jgi:hypothetical protein